ncbi:hypothetical protein [Stenotrophomonas daejeonensis]|uniref:hypothetical protein n=1 Tax=Stenotrophomonas daejeonensis TaxID=659018 RepID=UPI00128F6C60|nr:hypothetical protein [Stenotrophomonas daejeonensis]
MACIIRRRSWLPDMVRDRLQGGLQHPLINASDRVLAGPDTAGGTGQDRLAIVGMDDGGLISVFHFRSGV